MSYNKTLYTSNDSVFDSTMVYDSTEGKLQSEINASISARTGTRDLSFIEGGYISTSGATVDITSVIPSSTGYRYIVEPCVQDDRFLISVTGGRSPRAWCFIDSSGNSLSVAPESSSTQDKIIVAPVDSAYLVINDDSSGEHFVRKIEYNVSMIDGNNTSLGINWINRSRDFLYGYYSSYGRSFQIDKNIISISNNRSSTSTVIVDLNLTGSKLTPRTGMSGTFEVYDTDFISADDYKEKQIDKKRYESYIRFSSEGSLGNFTSIVIIKRVYDSYSDSYVQNGIFECAVGEEKVFSLSDFISDADQFAVYAQSKSAVYSGVFEYEIYSSLSESIVEEVEYNNVSSRIVDFSDVKVGSYNASDGSYKATPTDRLFTGFIPQNVSLVRVVDGFRMRVLVYDQNELWLGFVSPVGVNRKKGGTLFKQYDGFDHEQYKYRIQVTFENDLDSHTLYEDDYKDIIFFYEEIRPYLDIDYSGFNTRGEAGRAESYSFLFNMAEQIGRENNYVIDSEYTTSGIIVERMIEKNLYPENGSLTLSGTQIVNSYGQPIMLRGFGLFHVLSTFGETITKELLAELINYGVNCVRIPVYYSDRTYSGNIGNDYYYDVYESGWVSYPDLYKDRVEQIVSWCDELGLYAIVDFHVMPGEKVEDYAEDGIDFFEYFAGIYADNPRVIYEIANEPFYDLNNTDFDTYVKNCRDTIREYNQTAVILCGYSLNETGTVNFWQRMNALGVSDIVISHHYYQQYYSYYNQRKATYQAAGIPYFCSECGNVQSDGVTAGDDQQFLNLIQDFENDGVSYFFWKWGCRPSLSSTLKFDPQVIEGLYAKGFYSSDLTHNGRVYLSLIKKYSFFL